MFPDRGFWIGGNHRFAHPTKDSLGPLTIEQKAGQPRLKRPALLGDGLLRKQPAPRPPTPSADQEAEAARLRRRQLWENPACWTT